MEFFGIDNILYDNYEKIPFEENNSDSFLFDNETTSTILEKTFPKNIKDNNKNEENKKLKNKKKYRLKIFICHCGKVYRSKENVCLHYQNIHLKKKPYKCEYCNREFSHRNGKIYHVRKFHTKIFPYNCPFKESIFNILFFIVCNCSFPSKSSLRYHINSKHKNIINSFINFTDLSKCIM